MTDKAQFLENIQSDGDGISAMNARSFFFSTEEMAKWVKPEEEFIYDGDYQKYLRSARWRKIANEAKALAGWRCQVTNTPGDATSLHVHHRNYDHIGYEQWPDDIIVICSELHMALHAGGWMR
jgi:hypothetical protein